MNERRSGMAVASLVLGILSIVVCLGPLTGIPAIILGHIAYNRARKMPDAFGGAGLAIAGFVTGYVGLCLTLISLGLFLPALAQAKAKAQRINCANNLMQVGLAFRIFATDNGDQFPFNVGTNQGGTFEFCARGAEGFDQNAWRHFQVLSNELNTPKVLVCPADSDHAAASGFPVFGPHSLSYQLRSGTNVDESHPQEVLARCPIHNNVLSCDGSVQQLSKAR